MSALAKLRAREIFQKEADHELTKPTKAPFVGFVSSPPGAFQKNSTVVTPEQGESLGVPDAAISDTLTVKAEAIGPEATTNSPVRDWRISIPGRPTFMVAVSPPADAEWMQWVYPAAIVEPINEAKRQATTAEADELRRLIAIVLADSPNEQESALKLAMADADAAVECYRTLTRH